MKDRTLARGWYRTTDGRIRELNVRPEDHISRNALVDVQVFIERVSCDFMFGTEYFAFGFG